MAGMLCFMICAEEAIDTADASAGTEETGSLFDSTPLTILFSYEQSPLFHREKACCFLLEWAAAKRSFAPFHRVFLYLVYMGCK